MLKQATVIEVMALALSTTMFAVGIKINASWHQGVDVQESRAFILDLFEYGPEGLLGINGINCRYK
jgi:hypothetical protein